MLRTESSVQDRLLWRWGYAQDGLFCLGQTSTEVGIYAQDGVFCSEQTSTEVDIMAHNATKGWASHWRLYSTQIWQWSPFQQSRPIKIPNARLRLFATENTTKYGLVAHQVVRLAQNLVFEGIEVSSDQ